MPAADDFDSGFGEQSRYGAHLDRAWSLLEAGEVSQARRSGAAAFELRSDHPDACILLGAVCLADEDPDGAAQWYERAIDIDPEYVEPYAALAQIYLYDLDQPGRALELSNDALELDELSTLDSLDLQLTAVECLAASGEPAAVRARLESIGELSMVSQALGADLDDEDDEDDELGDEVPESVTEGLTALLGDDAAQLDEEEVEDVFIKLATQAVRACRVWLDLGEPKLAHPLLRASIRHLQGEAEAWYLLAESETAVGKMRNAVPYAIAAYRLDSQRPLPDWVPDVDALHTQVADEVADINHPKIKLGQPSDAVAPLIILIHEGPSLELVVEGLDPRTPVLALGFRPPRGKATLTGLAVYIRNLARTCPALEDFNRELRYAIRDELAVFFGLTDSQRVKLGLGPSIRAPQADPPPKKRKRQSKSKG